MRLRRADESRARRWLDETRWDVAHALRTFRQNPGFTTVAVLMLGVGIGINAAVFSITNAVLFKGFPLVTRNDRIAYLDTRRNGQGCCVSYPDFTEWRAGIVIHRPGSNRRSASQPQRRGS
jgi:putative ABC transport system permease protein